MLIEFVHLNCNRRFHCTYKAAYFLFACWEGVRLLLIFPLWTKVQWIPSEVHSFAWEYKIGCVQNTAGAFTRLLWSTGTLIPQLLLAAEGSWLLPSWGPPLRGSYTASPAPWGSTQAVTDEQGGTEDWPLASRQMDSVVLLMLQTSLRHQSEANLPRRTHNCLAFPPTLSAFPWLLTWELSLNKSPAQESQALRANLTWDRHWLRWSCWALDLLVLKFTDCFPTALQSSCTSLHSRQRCGDIAIPLPHFHHH